MTEHEGTAVVTAGVLSSFPDKRLPRRSAFHPEGMKEGSQGVEAAATPLVTTSRSNTTPEGSQKTSAISVCCDPSGVEWDVEAAYQGCRCAQPLATFCQPSGVKYRSGGVAS